jgi:tetratricopeptide (TPR) repeat protein
MKRGVFAVLCLAVCSVLACSAYAADQPAAASARDAYLTGLEERYQQAVSLREKGDYEASTAILDKLVSENPGSSKYEIARLDVILEQSRDMKESGNTAWKNKAREAAYRIKTLHASNIGNSDYWVLYAKYSWLIETNKETKITKALKKAFYYKPNNPEAYITQADYQFDKAREANDSGQYGMVHGANDSNASSRFILGQNAKFSYEAALTNKLSDERKAYVYYKLGNLAEQIFREKETAGKNWEAAIKLSPDSRSAKLAKSRLGS